MNQIGIGIGTTFHRPTGGSGGGGGGGGGATGTQSITMDGGFPNVSQDFFVGDPIYDDLKITHIKDNFGSIVTIFFATETKRDEFLDLVSGWTVGGVEMIEFTWSPTSTGGYGLTSTDGTAVAQYAAGTRDFIWTYA